MKKRKIWKKIIKIFALRNYSRFLRHVFSLIKFLQLNGISPKWSIDKIVPIKTY